MPEWLHSSKALIKSIAGTIGVKGLSLLISLFTTAAYMHYFSSVEVLGVWLALVSILNWIMNFDLGIGNGLRNKLVNILNLKDGRLVKQCISSAYIILGGVSLTVFIVGNLVLGFVNWNGLLKIPQNTLSSTVLLLVVRITFSGVILQFFLRLIISVLYAMQKPAIANLITLISHSLILVFVCLFRIDDIEKSMIVLSAMQAVTVNIPLIIATLWVFIKYLPYAIPSVKYYQGELAKSILNLGYCFLGIQLSLLIINSTNDFLITNLFGPEHVVEYQIYDKIFILISSGFSLVTVPVWSAVTKAYVENRRRWIQKTYQILLVIAALISIVSMILPLIYQRIVNIWLNDKTIQINMLNAYMFAIYNVILTFNYASTSIANGLGQLKIQIWCNTIAAIVKIPFVIILAGYTDNWMCVVCVNIIIMLPCVILQPIVNTKYLKKMGEHCHDV